MIENKGILKTVRPNDEKKIKARGGVGIASPWMFIWDMYMVSIFSS